MGTIYYYLGAVAFWVLALVVLFYFADFLYRCVTSAAKCYDSHRDFVKAYAGKSFSEKRVLLERFWGDNSKKRRHKVWSIYQRAKRSWLHAAWGWIDTWVRNMRSSYRGW